MSDAHCSGSVQEPAGYLRSFDCARDAPLPQDDTVDDTALALTETRLCQGAPLQARNTTRSTFPLCASALLFVRIFASCVNFSRYDRLDA